MAEHATRAASGAPHLGPHVDRPPDGLLGEVAPYGLGTRFRFPIGITIVVAMNASCVHGARTASAPVAATCTPNEARHPIVTFPTEDGPPILLYEDCATGSLGLRTGGIDVTLDQTVPAAWRPGATPVNHNDAVDFAWACRELEPLAYVAREDTFFRTTDQWSQQWLEETMLVEMFVEQFSHIPNLHTRLFLRRPAPELTCSKYASTHPIGPL